MRPVFPLASALCTVVLASCGGLEPVRQAEGGGLVDALIQPLDETRFAVSLTALNADGYEIARCIAAGYAESLRTEDGQRPHDVLRRDGGQLRDEFRVENGVRTQTTIGVQTFAFAPDLTVGDHDGRDVMAVDVQLPRCEKAGLPTGVS